MSSFRSLHDLPPLAGVCDFKEAQRPGLSVEECVRRLKRYHYALKRAHQIFNNRIPSQPIYELKLAFSLHSHYCAEHVAALRKRVGEMREPPLGLKAVPNANIEIFLTKSSPPQQPANCYWGYTRWPSPHSTMPCENISRTPPPSWTTHPFESSVLRCLNSGK